MTEFDEDTGEILPALPRQQQLMLGSSETTEVWTALLQAQAAIEAPQKTKTAKVKGQTRDGRGFDYEYAYAPLENIMACVREPFKEQGLGRQQILVQRGNQWMMRTIIFHKSGQWIGCDYPIFADMSRGAQGFASGVTYARRDGLMLALGLAAEDDDDANIADAQPATISATKANPASRPAPSADAALARSMVQRIRKEITEAAFAEQLNERGINGPTAKHDKDRICAQHGGQAVWDDLVKRDAKRRLELADIPLSGEPPNGTSEPEVWTVTLAERELREFEDPADAATELNRAMMAAASEAALNALWEDNAPLVETLPDPHPHELCNVMWSVASRFAEKPQPSPQARATPPAPKTAPAQEKAIPAAPAQAETASQAPSERNYKVGPVPVRGANGQLDYRVWAQVLFLDQARRETDIADLQLLISANEADITAYKASAPPIDRDRFDVEVRRIQAKLMGENG